MADLIKQLGLRIKQIRRAAKITQERLAEKTSLSVEFISRLERGVAQPSFKTLAIMADALNVTAKDFFDFKGSIKFQDRKREAKARKEYYDAISSELKGMEASELAIIYNIVKVLSGRKA